MFTISVFFSSEMALCHRLQPKSTLHIFRIGFLAGRTRCCFSAPELKEEVGVEETVSMAVEQIPEESSEKKSALVSKTTFISHDAATYGSSNNTITFSGLFMDHKDDQTETTEENEETQPYKAHLDMLIGCAEYRNTDFECLSYSNGPSPSEPASNLHDDHLNEFSPDKCENEQSVSYEGGERSSSSNKTHKVLDSKEWYMKSANNQASAEIKKPRNMTFNYEPSELASEPHHEDAEKFPHIKDILHMINVPKKPSTSTSSCNNSDLQILDNNDRLISRDCRDGTSKNEDEETSNSVGNKDQRQLKRTSFSRGKSEENRVFVRFLHSSIPDSQILDYFRSCGEILDVEYPNAGGSLLKSAYISFKTKNGLMKALKKSGSCLGKWIIVVESAATSMENVQIPIPSLIDDHDIPAALVKNPTRTIKIEKLTREINSCHIKEAMAFCGSNISGCFLGSSPSVAYVEFETEIGKERALAKQSIDVLGKHLVMLRIDSPRTTVVRITYKRFIEGSKIFSVCKSIGDVRQSFRRHKYGVDVQFGLSEWPNMLKILNRLNGFEIEGTRLQAEAAPIFPPDVLIALWHQPEERKLLKATAQSLLHKLGENKMDTSELASLQHVLLDKI